MVATHFFGKRYKNRGFRGFWKTRFFGKKWWNYFLPVFKAPHFLGVTFFGAFFFLLFSVSSASSKRVCSKKTYFYRVFLHTLLKHLVTSCSNNELKPKLPQKKVHIFFFFSETLFWPNFFSKTLILHHPLKTVHKKISKNPIFIGSKKDGQVIDPTVAKLLTLLWPKYGQVIDPTAYIYIYMLWSY